ncbi:MAG: hypothetical protein LBB56_03490 [Chitinispirillales bacterium]|jgi:hypothetical protein|nr:hypothetical protein [Chitinispirillales bacterium]
MLVGDFGQIRGVQVLSSQEEQRIKDFMHGAIYCWCKNRPDEWFALRDLFGGDNFNWIGTPLQILYEKEAIKGKDDKESINQAGKSAGRLLKKILFESEKRKFETKQEDMTRKYKFVKE